MSQCHNMGASETPTLLQPWSSSPSRSTLLFLYPYLPVQILTKDTRILEISVLAGGPPSLPAAMVAEVVRTVLEDLSQPAPSGWTELCASTLMLPLMTLPKLQAKSWPMCPVSELSTGQGHKSSSCSPVWVFTSREPSRVRFTADQLSTPT